MTFEFKQIGEEASVVLDLSGIAHDVETGKVQFPDTVVISSDQDEYSQPSYYVYQVGAEKFVYPLDTETLVVE